MSASWDTIPIAHACELFTDGNWIETKNQSPNGIRLIQTGNVGLGKFKDRREKARWISAGTFDRLKCKEVVPGDCLVSRLPDPVGRSCIIPETGDKMITAVDCSILRFDPKTMLPEFFRYYSQSILYLTNVESMCTGATRKRISRKNLGTIEIPFPPLPEQKRIVAILDEAFESITQAVSNAEKNLANARELFESCLNSVFTRKGEGWVEKRLNDVCLTFARGKSRHRPRNNSSLYDGEYPFIQTGDISRADHLITSYTQTYNEKGLSQSKLWPKGTICIAIVGATIGESGILDFDACFPDSVIGMVVDPKKADTSFIEYLLQHYKAMIKQQGEGTARPNINLGTFQNVIFPIPPLTIQKGIALSFDTLNAQARHLETIYQQKLTALAELKQSILQKAFSGSLTGGR